MWGRAILSGMQEPNLDEIRASDAFQNAMDRNTSIIGSVSTARLRHAQLGTWWERALALIVAAVLLAALIDNIVRWL